MNWVNCSKPKCFLSFLFIFIGFSVSAQKSYPDFVNANYTQAQIVMDGLLEEEAWTNAVKISNFTQRELQVNEPATERTEVAVLYDDKNLYIGVWCYDSDPEGIIAKENRRDFPFNLDDNFKIILDTYNDKRNGFMFIINPRGARADFQVFNNGTSINSFWNGVWDVRTTRNSEGWFAEVVIPLSTLKFRDMAYQEWGINFERNIRRKREEIFWQGWSRDARIENVNRAGTLTGLNQLNNKAFVEIKPYAIGGVSNNASETTPEYNIGGDINYLISPTYRLNVTVNTDFAQVESDRQQINLERFPLFFPELREFFLEGEDFFDAGFGGNRIVPFYTRRIGLDSERRPVPILAGARILGKNQNSTLGAMSIQTLATDNEPATNYNAFSWRQDVLKESVVGFMNVNKITANGFHTTTGANFRYNTTRFLKTKNLNFGGAYIRTYNQQEGWRGDAFAYRFFAGFPNDKYSIFASTQRSPEGFNPEVGLMRRTAFKEYFYTGSFNPRPKGKLSWIRRFEFVPFEVTYTQYDLTNELQTLLLEARPFGFSTRKGEFLNIGVQRQAEGLNQAFNIRTDLSLDSGTYWFTRAYFGAGTFGGRVLSANARISVGEFYNGTSESFVLETRWRISPMMALASTAELNNVILPNGSFQTRLFTARLDYAFNPRLFGLFYSQWNNNDEVFLTNFRLQWIPKIGSDFFLIVNRNWLTTNGDWRTQQTTVLAKFIWRFVV